MQLKIRAVSGDAMRAELLDLQLTILPCDKPADTTLGWWWIVFDEGEPVGFAGLHRSNKFGDTGYLCRSGVMSKYRGKGLQKRLIRVRERRARQERMVWLISDTYENPPSTNNLIACGYKTYIPREPWGADGVTYWVKRV
jgi:GNAT superfamily N-acetyltransferase